MQGTVELADFLDSDPEHRHGHPFIRGRRVSVDRISVLYNQGYTPPEIADDYSLTLAQVFAALAYYLANRDEVERGIDDLDAEGERLYAEHHAQRHGPK